MVDIPKKGKIKVHWNVSQYDYSKDKEEQLKAKVARKYNIPKANVTICQNIVAVDGSGKEVTLKDCMIENIQDPAFQKKLFKEYIAINKIEGCDFDIIDKIDNEVNAEIDYKAFDTMRHYTIKWIKWGNFRSYGPDNFFDFTQLHNLVLLNSNPANQGGKTTFAVDLLHYLLFGKLKKVDKNADMFNDFLPQETTMWVEGGLTIEGEDYIIKRTLSRPPLNKRTPKSKVTQKVEYYRVVGSEMEELTEYIDENGDDARKTNKIIAESIGREEDFDLMMCITGSNLDALTEEKPTERGRQFARWIGLLPLECKDEFARKKFNSVIKPSLLSNQYNKQTLLQEVEAYKQETETITKEKGELITKNTELEKTIVNLETVINTLTEQRQQVNQDVLRIDITTIENIYQQKCDEGIRKKAELESVKNELAEIGEVDFSNEAYDNLVKEESDKRIEINNIANTYNSLKKEIEALTAGEICPTCHRKLDNVDNSAIIKEKTKALQEAEKNGKALKEVIVELGKQIAQMKELREKYTRMNTLNAKISSLQVQLSNLRADCVELNQKKKAYHENEEAIRKNNQINLEIENQNAVLRTNRETKENNLRKITAIEANVTQYAKEIKTREDCIARMNNEEKLVMHWKMYLDMVGKNGISKMVMVKALPIINVRLSRLLEDVCDFDVQIEINSSNEVEFVMIQDGIKSSLFSHGSGFEKTAAALALRCVLAEVSTISKCNFVIIDEILGRIAKENFDNMRALYQRIAKNYDFIFQITHNEEVKEWHDTIVTVEKEGRISRIKVNK